MGHTGNGKKGAQDLVNGAILQCVEAATLGMPLEVWKTRMGRFRTESTIQALSGVYRTGGIRAFWAGTGPKMVESSTKGAILLWSKEVILDACLAAHLSPTMSGIIAGAGGGVVQVSTMGPCTFLVTAIVNGDKSISHTQRIKTVWQTQGIKGFYPGGMAIAWRQATNWASRQGFTEFVRGQVKARNHKGEKNAKLSVREEVFSGIVGGLMATWNHPFEVARIEAQSRAVAGEPSLGMVTILSNVYKEQGVQGLFKGVVPRAFLGVWQTLFMVTGAKLIQQHLLHSSK